MMQVRRAGERGHFDHGWLDTYHTFSFADYYNPEHMSFRALRVMNEDRVAGGAGFGMHPHRDMEILTYVLSGRLEHKDSLGHGEVLRPGEMQHMTAGTGVYHSEFNPDAKEPVHLYQVWLLPDRRGLEPGYGQKAFDRAERRDRLRVVASPDGREGSLKIHQDASVYLAELGPNREVEHVLTPGRHAWLQVLRGQVRVGGHELNAGDGLAVSEEPRLRVAAGTEAEVMLFDLA
ncbi:MAG: pirin family protein [Gemmataceae bacterium]